MRLREQWIRPLDALPQDYRHVIAITSSGQEEEMYLVDDTWHIVDGVRIPIEFVVFWHEKREQPTVEMAEDCISREEALKGMCDKCPRYNCVTECASHRYIQKIAPVQPQPKRGKWIDDGDCIICNKCLKAFGWISINMVSDFCPNCGADMREVRDGKKANDN